MTTATAPAPASICQRLDDVLLALELAATFWLQEGTADAARLWGAIDGLNARMRKTTFPLWDERIARFSALARAGLGETVFQAAYAEGLQMPLEEAVKIAMRPVSRPPVSHPEPMPLGEPT